MPYKLNYHKQSIKITSPKCPEKKTRKHLNQKLLPTAKVQSDLNNKLVIPDKSAVSNDIQTLIFYKILAIPTVPKCSSIWTAGPQN